MTSFFSHLRKETWYRGKYPSKNTAADGSLSISRWVDIRSIAVDFAYVTLFIVCRITIYRRKGTTYAVLQFAFLRHRIPEAVTPPATGDDIPHGADATTADLP